MSTAAVLKFRYQEPPSEAIETSAQSPRLGQKLELSGVSKSYGARQVLRGLDLEIEPGQFVAVVGRSGCGKTTLLRLLAGLEPLSAGRIRIGGKDAVGLQRSVRMLFQDSRLLQWQRVIANVGIAREPGWKATAQTALADVGLADRADDWPSVLSGGQKQRVALARALVSRPGVLLLDEPFGALDALTRSEMHDLLSRIWRERGFTAVLITHDVSEAVTLADRVLVLRQGRIAFDATVPTPRSQRRAGSAEAAKLQSAILEQV